MVWGFYRERQRRYAESVAWGYSGTNYQIAGLIAERASGMPLMEFLQRRVFTSRWRRYRTGRWNSTSSPAGEAGRGDLRIFHRAQQMAAIGIREGVGHGVTLNSEAR